MKKIIKKTFISFLSVLMMISMSPVNTLAMTTNAMNTDDAQKMVDKICKKSVTEKEVIEVNGDNGTSGIFSDNKFSIDDDETGEKINTILPFDSGIYLSSNGYSDSDGYGDGICDSDLKRVIYDNSSLFGSSDSSDDEYKVEDKTGEQTSFYVGNDTDSKVKYGSATWLSFKTKAKGSALSFNYVFASNEFAQDPMFNDTFGLFITNKEKAKRELEDGIYETEEEALENNTVNIATFNYKDEEKTISISTLLAQSYNVKGKDDQSVLQTLDADEKQLVDYEPADGYKDNFGLNAINYDTTKFYNTNYGQTQAMQALYDKDTYDYLDDDELEIKFAIANCGQDNKKSSYVFIQANSLGFDMPGVKINYAERKLYDFEKGTYQITESNDDNYLFTFNNTNKEDNAISFAGEDDNGISYDFEGDQIKIAEYNTDTHEASKETFQILQIDKVGVGPTQINTNFIDVVGSETSVSRSISFKGIEGEEYMILPDYIDFNDKDTKEFNEDIYNYLWEKNGKKYGEDCDKDEAGNQTDTITFDKYFSRAGTENKFPANNTQYYIYSRYYSTDDNPASSYTRSNYRISFESPNVEEAVNATDIDANGTLTMTTDMVYKEYSSNKWAANNGWKKANDGENKLPVGKYCIRKQYKDDDGVTIIGSTQDQTINALIPSSLLNAVNATSVGSYGTVYGVNSKMQYSLDNGNNWCDVDDTENEYVTSGKVNFIAQNYALNVKADDKSSSVSFRYKTVNSEGANIATSSYDVGVISGIVRFNLHEVTNLTEIKNGTDLIFSDNELNTDLAYTNNVNIISVGPNDAESVGTGHFYTFDWKNYDNLEYGDDGYNTDYYHIAYNINAYKYIHNGKTTVELGTDKLKVWLQKTDEDGKVVEASKLELFDESNVSFVDGKNVLYVNYNENNVSHENVHDVEVKIGDVHKTIFIAGKLSEIDESKNTIEIVDPVKDGEKNAALVFNNAENSDYLLDAARQGKLQYSKAEGNGIAPNEANYENITKNDINSLGELKVTGGNWYAIRYKETYRKDENGKTTSEIEDAASDPIYVYVKLYKTTKGLDVVGTDANKDEMRKGYIYGLDPTTMELSTSDKFDKDSMVDLSTVETTGDNKGILNNLNSYDYYYVRYKELKDENGIVLNTVSDSVKLEIPTIVTTFAADGVHVVYHNDASEAPTVTGLQPHELSYSQNNTGYVDPKAGMEYYQSDKVLSEDEITALSDIDPVSKKDSWVDVTSKADLQLDPDTKYFYVRQIAYDRDGEKDEGEKGYFIDTYASNVVCIKIENELDDVDVENVKYDSSKSVDYNKTYNNSGLITGVTTAMCYRKSGSGNAWITVSEDDVENGINATIGKYEIAYSDDVDSRNKSENSITVTVKYAEPEAECHAPTNNNYGYIFNAKGAYVLSQKEYEDKEYQYKKLITSNAFNDLQPGTYYVFYWDGETNNPSSVSEVKKITIPESEVYTKMTLLNENKEELIAANYDKGTYLVSEGKIDNNYLASDNKATIILSNEISYVYNDKNNWSSSVKDKYVYSFENVTYANKDVKVYYKDLVERPSTASNADNSNITVSADDIVVKFKSTKEDDPDTYTLMRNGSYDISSTDNLVNIGDPYASNIVSDDIDLVIGKSKAFSVKVNACETKIEATTPTVGVNEPTKDNNGQITGVTSEMEYVLKSTYEGTDDKDSVEWKTGNSNGIVTVPSGEYYVRFRTKDNYEETPESKFATVFVPYYTGYYYTINVSAPDSVHKGSSYKAEVKDVTIKWRSNSTLKETDQEDNYSKENVSGLTKDGESLGLTFNETVISGNSISKDTICRFTLTDKNGEVVATKSVTIKCEDHTKGNAVKENVVDPTCTVAGSYDSVVYCTVCGDEISRKQVTVSALGHSVVTDAYVAATGAATGLTEGSHCSRCGTTLVAQQTIGIIPNAVGYTYKVGSTECRIITNTDASRTVAYKNKQNTTKYQTIGETVNLNGQTFTVTALKRDCVNGTYVRTLTLASTITNWEYGAFNGDNRLTKINVKSTTLNVESGAFAKMKASAKAKLKVYVTKKMSKKAFNTLKAQLVKEGLKASNIRRM